MNALRQPAPSGDIRLRGWRKLVTEALADRVGVLAEIIVEEALDDLAMDESHMRLAIFNRFLLSVYRQLPDDVDRQEIVQMLQDRLIDQLRAVLRRDLTATLGKG